MKKQGLFSCTGGFRGQPQFLSTSDRQVIDLRIRNGVLMSSPLEGLRGQLLELIENL